MKKEERENAALVAWDQYLEANEACVSAKRDMELADLELNRSMPIDGRLSITQVDRTDYHNAREAWIKANADRKIKEARLESAIFWYEDYQR